MEARCDDYGGDSRECATDLPLTSSLTVPSGRYDTWTFLHYITHDQLASINACKVVFPDAKRLICTWHIYQNVMKHCRPSITNSQSWNSFYQAWLQLLNSPNQEWYTHNLAKLQEKLLNYPGVLDYVDRIWLTPHKEMFVSAWADQFLHFGNQTTNRVENYTSRLEKHLEHIDGVILSQDTSIKASFEYKNVLGLRKPTYFLEIVVVNCVQVVGCHVRMNKHYICVNTYLFHLMRSMYFGKKLDFSPCVSALDDEIQFDDEVQMFRETSTKQSVHGRKSMFKKLKDMVKSSKAFSKKNNIDDPHSSYFQRQPATPNPYLDQIPSLFHPYIAHIENVLGDGNCGFRAISTCLGGNENAWDDIRRDLMVELTKYLHYYSIVFGSNECGRIYEAKGVFAPAMHWIVMPGMAILTASRYNVILHVLSMRGNVTYLPQRTLPLSSSSEHVLIVIVHVDNNHYIKVVLIH
ncbi:hypothetical protein OSB04_032026 [Centaurea solstitialis]|uniref:Protein FAR1-RELATED SEQUENCE n=1 Tax=Centaurea solstitialis TaxID=347529 RepID=A0AA38SBJ2_9ASTR|nr:hypothetical protein OSB04_032026 [Centaurea solstitialis]